MANLVAPIIRPQPIEERIIEFKGLNRKSIVEDGEMSDMTNLTSDNYPLLCPRKLRGQFALPEEVSKPLKIMSKYERIAMIAKKSDDTIAFFYDGNEIASVTGLTEDTEMVAINTKICFFPQKTYLTITRSGSSVTVGSYGHMDATVTLTSATLTISNTSAQMVLPSGHGIGYNDAIDLSGTATFIPDYTITSDGTKKYVVYQSDSTGCDIQVPSGVKFCGIKQSGSTDFWIVAASDSAFTMYSYIHNTSTVEATITAKLVDGKYIAYTRWYSPNPEPKIKYYTISATTSPADIAVRMIYGADVNVSCTVEAVVGNTITLPRESFIELTGDGVKEVIFTGTIKRSSPDIKHVIEWNNRLWGVSDEDNTVYACKLGDPTNWKYYQGTSLDSFYAQQGTDENWTGSAAYSGHLIFFKPNSMTKIYGTAPSNFQVTNAVCYGVEPGSSKSVSIVNDTVFYKSSVGIMAYDGGTPYGISDKLNVKFHDVVGGTEGRKYYASIVTDDNVNELMVLDVDRAVWHKEDDARFRDCCTLDGRLYFIEDSGTDTFEKDKVYIINPETATEKNRKWAAVFGPFDEFIEDQKIYSKMSMRIIAKTGTKVNVYINMNDGAWETVRKFEFAETGGETIMIVPRRCDRFSIKLSGIGDCEIKSLTRRFRRGSGVRHGS